MKIIQRAVLAYYKTKFQAISLVSPKIAAASAFDLFCTPYSKPAKIAEPETFTTAEKISIKIEGYVVKGFYWKPKQSNGHKILICHGFDSRTYNFEKYVIALLDKNFEVIAFDAPAHGLSSGKTINVGIYRDMILQINNQFGPINGMISHSFGGLAVALAVEEMKDKQHKRLVFIAPATETTTAINHFFKFIPVHKKVKDEFDALIIKKGGQPSSWFSVARVVQEIKTPTLWIHDTKDTITPYADMEHLVKMDLPHVEFKITTGLGHSQIYRTEDILHKVVTFFKPFENIA